MQKVVSTLSVALLTFSSSLSLAAIPDYNQDFEGLLLANDSSTADDGALSGDGWLIFANVHTGVELPYPGNLKFNFGPFSAPNRAPTEGPGFSAVAMGDAPAGGIGAQYLNIFSDYQCCGPGTSNEGHFDPADTEVVHALVFREATIAADDIGKTVIFSFDAKRPDLIDDGFGGDLGPAVGSGCLAPCTAGAFLKTLDPNAGFATTNILQTDMTAISQSDWVTYTITLDLSDPLLEGQILQFGFENFASNFENSGVYYDNIILSAVSSSSVNVPIPGFAIGIFSLILSLVGITAIKKRLRA